MESSGHERRAAPRIRLQLVGIWLDGQWHVHGRIRDISALGARIEDCGVQPAVGERARLGFLLPLGEDGATAERFDLEGIVVRHTEPGGFTVRFHEIDVRLGEAVESLLRHASALSARALRESLRAGAEHESV